MLVARLGGMAFSQEGKSFWMLKTAPVRVSQMIQAKFTTAYLPGLLIGWTFLVALAILQRGALSALWFTAPAVALIIAGNTGLQLTFGITGANMTWNDPRQMQRSSAGCFSVIASLVYMPVAFGMFFLPPLGVALLGIPEWTGQVVGLLLGGVLSLVCAIVPLRLVSDRVLLLGEAT
jgi:Putative ATP-binding cassette